MQVTIGSEIVVISSEIYLTISTCVCVRYINILNMYVWKDKIRTRFLYMCQ